MSMWSILLRLIPHSHRNQDVEAAHPETEKSPDVSSTRARAPPPTKGDGLESNSSEASEGDGDGPYAKDYQPDALIWQLYLEEAGAEDKEMTELWKNGLDSLLLFAGLFAGIITAFIIQSRQALKENPQEHLLREILYSISNNSSAFAPQSFQPTTVSLGINFLWFFSFTLTLTSALGGVIAKGWVAKFSPASRTDRCQGACERHLRYLRALQWHLAEILTGLPILIQLALLIFFIGLILFTHSDNVGIGFIILVLVGFTLLLYLVSTILPFFSPASPLHTPISDFIHSAIGNGRDKTPPTNGKAHSASGQMDKGTSWWKAIKSFLTDVQSTPLERVIKADILAWVFVNSKNDKTLEEAVKALAGTTRKSTIELRDAFQKYGADKYFCQRFVRCFESTSSDVCEKEAYLYALLRLIQPILPTDTPYDNLQFADLLNPTQPLHRWDDFEPCLWTLAFSVRTHILANQNKDDDNDDVDDELWGSWERTRNNLECMAEAGSSPYMRRILVEAAVRGLIGNKKNLKRASGLVLSKRLKSADVRETIRTQQVAASKGRDPAIVQVSSDHLKDVLRNFLGLLEDDDDTIRDSVSQGLITLGDHLEYRSAIIAGIPALLKLLGSAQWGVFDVAARTVSKLADKAEFRPAITPYIPTLVKELQSNSWRDGGAASEILLKLADQAEFRSAITPCIPTLVKQLQSSNWSDRGAASDTLSKLIDHTESRSAISPYIPTLVQLLESPDSDIQIAATNTLLKLIDHVKFHPAIASCIPKFLMLLDSTYWEVQGAAGRAVSKLADYVEFHTAISPCIPTLMTLLDSTHWEVQVAAGKALSRLSEHVYFHSDIAPCIPTLLKLLESTDSDVHTAAADAVLKLVDLAEFRAAITTCVPRLVKLLKSPTSDIQAAAARALSTLAYHGHHPEYRPAIPTLVRLLKSADSDVQIAASGTLSKFADHAKFHTNIFPCIPTLVKLLDSTHWEVQVAAARALSKVANHVRFHAAIAPSILILMSLLESTDSDVQAAAACTLAKLADHSKLRTAITPYIPSLVKLLMFTDFVVQAATAKILCTIGGVSGFEINKSAIQFRLSIGAAMEQCLDTRDLVTTDGDPRSSGFPTDDANLILPISRGERVLMALDRLQNGQIDAATYSLQSLNTFTRCVIQIMGPLFYPVNSLVALLESTIQEVLAASSDALLKLADHAELRIAIAPCIPKLLKLLHSTDSDIQVAASKTLSRLADHAEFRSAIAPCIPMLVKLLESWYVRDAASESLSNFAGCAEFRAAIVDNIPTLMKLLDSPDWLVQVAAARVLSNFASHAKLRTAMPPCIPPLLTLLSSPYRGVQAAAADTLSTFAALGPIEWHDAIAPCIPTLMLLLESSDWLVRFAAADALSELVYHVITHIHTLVTLLEPTRWSLPDGAARALSKLVEHAQSRSSITPFIPIFVKLVDSTPHQEVRDAASKVLSKLAEHVEFCAAIAPCIPTLMRLLESSDSEVHAAAADTLQKLADQVELHSAISPFIPTFAKLLDSARWKVQVAAGHILSKLADHVNFTTIDASTSILMKQLQSTTPIIHAAASDTPSNLAKMRTSAVLNIPKLVKMLESSYSYVRIVAAGSLSKLADHVEFHTTIAPYIPTLVKLLGATSWKVQVAASDTLSKLAKNADSRPAIAPCIPKLVKLLDTGGWTVQVAAARALSELANDISFHRAIAAGIPLLVKMLASTSEEVRVAIPDVLSELAHHAELYTVIADDIPRLVKLVVDSTNSEVQVAAVCALSKLSDHIEVCRAIARCIPTLFKLLESRRLKVRDAAGNALLKLVDHDEFLLVINSSISQSLFKGLSSDNGDIASSFMKVFCQVYLHGYLQDMLLQVIMLALTSLKAQDYPLQLSGVTILEGLAEHSIFIPRIYSVASVMGFFEHFTQDIPCNLVQNLLEQMVSFGCLEGF